MYNLTTILYDFVIFEFSSGQEQSEPETKKSFILFGLMFHLYTVLSWTAAVNLRELEIRSCVYCSSEMKRIQIRRISSRRIYGEQLVLSRRQLNPPNHNNLYPVNTVLFVKVS